MQSTLAKFGVKIYLLCQLDKIFGDVILASTRWSDDTKKLGDKILLLLPVVDVIKHFLRKSRFPQNWEIQKSLFWCLNLHKNAKTIRLLSCKTKLQNYLLQLKWLIIAVSAWGGNMDFLDFLQKKFYNINYWNKKERKRKKQTVRQRRRVMLMLLPVPVSFN